MLGDGIIEASARGPRIRQEETQIAGSRTTMGDGVDASPDDVLRSGLERAATG